MESCPFCDLAAGAGVVDDALVALRTPGALVIPALKQRHLNRGHMLVVPRTHVTRLAGADAALLADLYTAAGRVSQAVRTAFGATGATLFQNDRAPDQVLHHLHIHVVPRRAGDEFKLPDPASQVLDRAERVQQAAALRRALG